MWTLGLLALLPSAWAVATLGRLHPDEVYQVLEPAWYRVHGYGVLAWEWREGLRSWAVPLVYAGFLHVCRVLGVEHPVAARAVLGVPLVLLQATLLLSVFSMARRRVGTEAGAVAAVLVGLSGPVLLFAGRTLSETHATAFLVLAVGLLEGAAVPLPGGQGRDRSRVRWWGVAAGAALGLSVVARYGSAVPVLAALAWLVASRRWALLAWTCVGGAAVAVGLGALDAATWGRPFHSLLAYVDFNLLSGLAATKFGSAPPWFYLPLLLRALPVWALVGFFLAARRRAWVVPVAVVMAAADLTALMLTPHKEERFLYPACVLLAVAAAPAVAGALTSLRTRRARTLAATGVLAAGLLPLAFAPDVRGDQFRALVQASRPPATGLLIVNEGLWGAGGYFYLGRRLPWLTCDWPQDAAFRHAVGDPRFNRAITFEGRALAELQAAGFRVVGQVGRETLLERPANAKGPRGD